MTPAEESRRARWAAARLWSEAEAMNRAGRLSEAMSLGVAAKWLEREAAAARRRARKAKAGRK